MTAAYRALFCDLLTDQVIDVLPLLETQFDDFIGKPGSLSATVPLPNAAVASRARAALTPGRTAVWLERNAEIWWGGVLWTCTPAGDERGRLQVQIQAGGFDSYLDHRYLSQTLTFTGEDQLDIARALINHLQAQPGGDIGIEYGSEASGVVRSHTYLFTDLARVREILEALAATENGFEWRIAAYRDTGSGRRVKRLQVGHPVIRTGAADIVLDRPGPVTAYSLPGDSTVQANVWVARGEADNTNQAAESVPRTAGPVVSEEDLTAGWPRLEGSSDHSSVTDTAVLEREARAALARARRPQVIPEITVLMDDGRIRPALLGSSIRLRIHDLWHPDGLDARYRVVGLAVTPPARGQAESAKLYLEEA